MNRQIRSKIRKATEKSLKKLKSTRQSMIITGTHKVIKAGILEDRYGTLITDVKLNLRRWTEYITDLFDDKRT